MKTLTPKQQEIRTGSSNQSVGAGEIDLKKGYLALDGRATRALTLVDQLRSGEPVDLLCLVFEVHG
jgi:hypothetical protein